MSELSSFKAPSTIITDNIFVINLRKIPGGESSIIQRIPEKISGVYAFYKNLDPKGGEDENSEKFNDFILEQIKSKHFIDRSGSIAPHYNVKLSSSTFFSENKSRALSGLCESDSFKKCLLDVFSISLFFQGPLYIGKAKNLRDRISNHLYGKTDLKLNLLEANIDICDCKLFIIKTEFDSSGYSGSDIDPENLFEDILSRIFLPSFTSRYG